MSDYSSCKCRITGKMCEMWSEVAGCGLVFCKFKERKKLKTLELKPCPFCGGVAIQVYSVNADSYVYGCRTIACPGNAQNQLHRFKSDKEAIEMWNRRVGGGCAD